MRDLAPCIYARERIFVAPLDSNRLLCLDPVSGRLLWEQEGLEIVQLLGVAGSRLVFTTTRGIQAVDMNGNPVWQTPVVGKTASHGRGILAGSWVLWPTRSGQLPVRALHLLSGTPEHGTELMEPTRLRQLPSGNLAYANGCLVIAGSDELTCYVSARP